MSDMTTSVAVAEAAKWGNLIRALSRLAEVADYLYAQEQVQHERERALAALQAEIDGAAAARDFAKEQFERELDLAKRAADKHRSEALGDAKDAREQADAADATARASRADAEHWQQVARDAQADVEEAKRELERVRASIKAAKAAAIKQLGG